MMKHLYENMTRKVEFEYNANGGVDYFSTLLNNTKTSMEEMTPAEYALLTAFSVFNQTRVIKKTKKRFPRFSKGYAVMAVLSQIGGLAWYVHIQREQAKRAEMQGLGVCLHCGRYPCRCEEVDIWRTEDQLKGYEPTDLEKREGLPEHTRPEKREWMITHGLCPDCGGQRDSITGCPKHG